MAAGAAGAVAAGRNAARSNKHAPTRNQGRTAQDSEGHEERGVLCGPCVCYALPCLLLVSCLLSLSAAAAAGGCEGRDGTRSETRGERWGPTREEGTKGEARKGNTHEKGPC